MCEAHTKGKYGEPWREYECEAIVTYKPHRERACACVTALDGVPDPAQQIERWKAIEAAAKQVMKHNICETCNVEYDGYNCNECYITELDNLICEADTEKI